MHPRYKALFTYSAYPELGNLNEYVTEINPEEVAVVQEFYQLDERGARARIIEQRMLQERSLDVKVNAVMEETNEQIQHRQA